MRRAHGVRRGVEDLAVKVEEADEQRREPLRPRGRRLRPEVPAPRQQCGRSHRRTAAQGACLRLEARLHPRRVVVDLQQPS